ncbi:T9SS type A sorting domain-containing protein [Arcicella aquatica]|uniref:T9SS type A sorting domain-containing protein n=1 Tax=Arcicella aquatica TaxID=217141 RepID=A0ABU5QJQ1_9BACT|nr:T9SS type A sorting domain-containing protein [Arcicella aquatica]MEA5257268.1 T9SS type A sorting domain-containing protein [Arcicella aquatica]
MKKVILLLTFILHFTSSISSQSYSIEKTFGGFGEIGEQLKNTVNTYCVSNQSIYFIDPYTRKLVIEVDEQGIIKNKYKFPVLSKALNNETFNEIGEITIDKEDRIIVYCESNKQIFCFAKDGSMVYNIRNLTSYLDSEIWSMSFATDSKNNLYIGTRDKITLLDRNGKIIKTIGKKGTNNGEFTGNIFQMFVDKDDNLFVVNNNTMQQFDVQGNFINKFDCIYKGKLAIDENGKFYGASDYYTIKVFDKTGKILSSIEFGSSTVSVLNVVAVFSNKLIAHSLSGYNTFTLDGKKIAGFIKSSDSDGSLYYIEDFNFDENDKLWIYDWNKIQQFGLSSEFLQRINFNKTNYYSAPIISIKSTSELIHYNSQDRTLYSANYKNNTKKQIIGFNNTDNLNYLNIDSTRKEIIALWNTNSSKDYVSIYDLEGNYKRNLVENKILESMVRDKQGYYYLITSQSNNKFNLLILDENGKEVNFYNLAIGEFGTSVIGMTIDEYGVIHVGIRDVYGGKGFTMYAYNKQGVMLASKLNIADNSGNFTGNQSYLLKYYKGYLYFADIISNQIFKIKYTPNGKELKENIILNPDITKTIGETDFLLTPTASSTAPFVYTLISGDAINLSTDGKIKILKKGVAKVKISQLATTEYAAAERIVTITVNLLMPVFTNIEAINKKVGDADFTLNPISTSDGQITYSVTSGDAVTVTSSGIVKVIKAGKANITISQASNSKFEASSMILAITVSKVAQTINFTQLPSEIYQNIRELSLNATATSNLPVSFKVTSGSATILGNNLKLTGSTGKIIIESNQAGNDKYEPAPAINQTIEVLLLLATDEELQSKVSLYPNPGHDYLNIKSDKIFLNYEIINIHGVEIVPTSLLKENKINLQFLPKGVYFIRLIEKSGISSVLKFVMD